MAGTLKRSLLVGFALQVSLALVSHSARAASADVEEFIADCLAKNPDAGRQVVQVANWETCSNGKTFVSHGNYTVDATGGTLRLSANLVIGYAGSPEMYQQTRDATTTAINCAQNFFRGQGIPITYNTMFLPPGTGTTPRPDGITEFAVRYGNPASFIVSTGAGRSDQGNIFIVNDQGVMQTPGQQCSLMAHELGHSTLGLPDRYENKTDCPDRKTLGPPDDIMANSFQPISNAKLYADDVAKTLAPLCGPKQEKKDCPPGMIPALGGTCIYDPDPKKNKAPRVCADGNPADESGDCPEDMKCRDNPEDPECASNSSSSSGSDSSASDSSSTSDSSSSDSSGDSSSDSSSSDSGTSSSEGGQQCDPNDPENSCLPLGSSSASDSGSSSDESSSDSGSSSDESSSDSGSSSDESSSDSGSSGDDNNNDNNDSNDQAIETKNEGETEGSDGSDGNDPGGNDDTSMNGDGNDGGTTSDGASCSTCASCVSCASCASCGSCGGCAFSEQS